MCHAINSNWHLTSTSHSVPCMFLLLWDPHCYLDQKIFQSYHFMILWGVHKLYNDLGATSKFLAPQRWNWTLFITASRHIFGTTVQNSASRGVLAPGICAPLHQLILTGQNCWGADTSPRTVLTTQKEPNDLSQDIHLYVQATSPPTPQKKFNRFLGLGVFKKVITKAVLWYVPTFWRNLPPISSGYSGWGTLNITRLHSITFQNLPAIFPSSWLLFTRPLQPLHNMIRPLITSLKDWLSSIRCK